MSIASHGKVPKIDLDDGSSCSLYLEYEAECNPLLHGGGCRCEASVSLQWRMRTRGSWASTSTSMAGEMWDAGWGAWILRDVHMMAGELVLVSECPFGMSSESFFRFRPAAVGRPWKCGSKADYQLQIPEPTSLGVNTAIAVCWCMLDREVLLVLMNW